MDLLKLARKNIVELKPYSTARDEFQGEAEVFLDANENPFPTDYNRYPDPLQKKLKVEIATLKEVSFNQVFLGNGSDEAIDLLIRVFCEPGNDSILITEPTYGMYQVCADINHVTVKRARLTSGFNLNLQEIKSKIDLTVKLIFLCSPNNPSGNLLDTSIIKELLTEFKGLVIIDEAYVDFSNSPSHLKQLTAFKNLVVLQTFSKAWGLAGLRLGMCFADEQIISLLNKTKYPYNINSVTQKIALERIKMVDQKNNAVNQIITERNKMRSELKELKIVDTVYSSDSNFLLVKFLDAKTIYSRLLEQKIIVRDRSNVILCNDCLRITIGTPTENKLLLNVLQNL